MSTPIVVHVDAPVAEVFAYLADPRNRPEWQTSLRTVRLLQPGEPRVGLAWIDVTAVPGIKPRMEITEMTPFRVWAESGTFAGVRADLTLRFSSAHGGTRVSAEFDLSGRGLWAVPAGVAQRLAPRELAKDLRRAAGLIEQRARG